MDQAELHHAIARLRGDPAAPPAGAIIVPVNAQADLGTVLRLLGDLGRYRGSNTFEIILVINNYPPTQPPPAIEQFRALGATVVAVPDVRQPGKRVAIAARIRGAEQAAVACTLHFDADCRIPDATALLDWYVAAHRAGARAAYTPVGFFDVRREAAIRARIAAHHMVRWVKRALLRIPTIRGSNFAIDRDTLLRLNAEGYLAADFNIGPAVKAHGGPVVYSGRREHAVLTSGRYIESGWGALGRYLIYRLKYNITMLPVRRNVKNPDWKQALQKPYRIYSDDHWG
jgi:hypothetical protein